MQKSRLRSGRLNFGGVFSVDAGEILVGVTETFAHHLVLNIRISELRVAYTTVVSPLATEAQPSVYPALSPVSKILGSDKLQYLMSSCLPSLFIPTKSIKSTHAYHRLYCILKSRVERSLISRSLVAPSSLVAAKFSNMLIGIGSSINILLFSNTEQCRTLRGLSPIWNSVSCRSIDLRAAVVAAVKASTPLPSDPAPQCQQQSVSRSSSHPCHS